MASASVTYAFAARDTDSPSSFAEVNTNFSDIVDFLNDNTLHKDGSKTMTGQLTLLTLATTTNHAASKNYVDFIFAITGTTSPLPVGTIVLSPASSLSGFVRCNGAAYSPGALPALYAIIGTTYGGYPAPPWAVWTFNVPNLADLATNLHYYVKTS